MRTIVTNHVHPVAKAKLPIFPTREERLATIRRIKELRKGNRLDGLTWKELRDEGRS